MKITTTVEINPVEAEVEISVLDVLAEFSQRMEETDRKSCLHLLDFATELLARIPDDAIDSFSLPAKREVVARLSRQLERYTAAIKAVTDVLPVD